MTRFVLSAVTLAALPALASTQTPARQPSSAGVTEFVVAGIPVIHKPILANDVIAVRLYIKGGAAALGVANAGIERFIGEMATRGTRKYSKDEFASRATATGTNVASEVAFDYTVITAQAVRQHWDEAWELFSEAALHPTFPQDEMQTVRDQILNDLKQRRDTPDSHLQMAADSVLYTGHAYAADPLGRQEAVSRLTRDDLARWHRRRLAKANLLLVVVGNVSRSDLAAKVRAAFAGLPATGGAPPRLVPMGVLKPDVVVIKQELPTNYIMGVYVAPNPSSRDFPALRVATRVLSERLFEEVRTKRNLSYAVSSGLSSLMANRGTLYVTAVQPETTLKVILHEVRRLQQEPLPVSRMGQSINVFLTQHWMQQETNMGQAAQLGLWELNGGGWENALRYVARLRAVTPAQVQRVARTYLKNARFVVIGDPSKVDRALFTSL